MTDPRFREIPGAPGFEVNRDAELRAWWRKGDGRPVRTREALAVPEPRNAVKLFGGRYLGFAVLRETGRQWVLTRARAVLLAWVGEPPGPLMVAYHCNGNRLDDRLANLRWDDTHVQKKIPDELFLETAHLPASLAAKAIPCDPCSVYRRRRKLGIPLAGTRAARTRGARK